MEPSTSSAADEARSPAASPERSSWQRSLRNGAIGAGVLVGLYLIRGLIQLLVVALLLAYVLNPLVTRLERRTSRTVATLIVFAGLVGLIGGVAALFVPSAFNQLQALQSGMKSAQAQELVQALERSLEPLVAPFGIEDLQLQEQLEARARRFVQSVIGVFSNALSIISNAVVIPFMTVFMLKDGPEIKRALVRLVPNRYFEFTLNALHKTDQQLGNYLRGLAVDVLAVASMATFALWLLDIDYFPVLGALAGMTTIVPYIGTILGAVPAAAVTLITTNDVVLVAYVVGAFLAIQILDEAVVQPLVLSKSVDVHPLLLVTAVVVGGQFFGALGLVLAAPAASVLKVVLTESLTLIRRYRFA
jgi:putative permease